MIRSAVPFAMFYHSASVFGFTQILSLILQYWHSKPKKKQKKKHISFKSTSMFLTCLARLGTMQSMIAEEKRFGRRRNSRLDSITMICANAESTSSILHRGHKLLNIVTRKLNKSLLCTVHCTALRGGELSFLDAACNEHLFSC